MAIANEITRSYISKNLDFEKLDISRYQASIVILSISVIEIQRTAVEKVKERGRDSKDLDIFEWRPAQETYTDE